MTRNHSAARSVARDAREASPADQVSELLAELHDRVETRESVITHRRVRRGRERIIAVPDVRPHHTAGPGLLVQLGVIASTGSRPGTVVPGAAVPQGSPGWDADGALAPLTASGKPESAEPVTDAWHVAQETRAALDELVADVAAAGYRTLVDAALDDPDEWGAYIAARLRALVSRARIAASYDAPIVPLRDVCCPLCGGELRVRTDASSAVRCAGSIAIHGPAQVDEAWPLGWVACGARWPRGAWVALLADAEPWEPPEPPRNDHSPAHAPRETPAHPLPAVLAGLAPETE